MTDMNKYFCFVVTLLLLASCGSSEEPVSVQKLRLSFIYSDNYTEVFGYDSEGRVAAWTVRYSQDDSGDRAVCTYTYPGDGVIAIESDENRGPQRWLFSERLSLGPNGTADRANGKVKIYEGSDLIMQKNYTTEFTYSPDKELIGLTITENRTDGAGWEEPDALTWHIDLEWADGNLIRHTEYTNREHPITTHTYSYYGGETALYKPILQWPVLRLSYTPLMYAGVFGCQSVSLLKEATLTDRWTEYTESYAYSLSILSTQSAVEEYTCTTNNSETKYVVGWDNASR